MANTFVTNELKKGMKVLLNNGWEAIIMDNKKGNTRMAEVHGMYTETGSVYAHDIGYVYIDNKPVKITHTDAQLKLKKMVESF